jgi:hypothetical protein
MIPSGERLSEANMAGKAGKNLFLGQASQY